MALKKIRILHIVSSLSIDSGVMGVIMNYYRHIDQNKIQFDFLYFLENEKNHKVEIENLGGICYSLPKPSVLSYKEYIKFFKLKADNYKAVHLHEIYLNSIILPMAKKFGINHLITHSHATEFSDKKLNDIRNKILCLPINRQATIPLACSKAAGYTAYGKKNVDSGKVKIVNNAVNIDKFKFNPNVREKVRSELCIKDKFVIGHVGRFKEQKNHSFLINVFAELKKKRSNSILMLIGDGPLFENIRKKVKSLNIEDSVIFLGRKNNVQDYFQAMDIFILPSLFEGLPVVGVEAQAAGLPIFMSANITREIGLLNYAYIELRQSAEYWADKILSVDNKVVRHNSYLGVVKAGFDINEESKKLEKFYTNLP